MRTTAAATVAAAAAAAAMRAMTMGTALPDPDTQHSKLQQLLLQQAVVAMAATPIRQQQHLQRQQQQLVLWELAQSLGKQTEPLFGRSLNGCCL
jgi:hypothetical protein